MRSSRSRPDPLDPGPAGYAHRGLHRGFAVPENTLAAFAAALEFGAGIECDLRLTADDRVIVFHDADASRLCGSPLRVAESTFDQVSRLRVGDERVPTLEQLITLVAGRAPMLLEVKVQGDVPRWAAPLGKALAGYRGAFGVMSFDPRVPRLLRRSMPQVRRGLVVRDNLAAPARRMAIWLAGADFLSVERTALGKGWAERARRRVPVYSWTVATAAEREQASVHADALIWEGDGRPRI